MIFVSTVVGVSLVFQISAYFLGTLGWLTDRLAGKYGSYECWECLGRAVVVVYPISYLVGIIVAKKILTIIYRVEGNVVGLFIGAFVGLLPTLAILHPLIFGFTLLSS